MAPGKRGGDAYKSIILDTEHPRDIERRVFSQVTRALEDIGREDVKPYLSDNAHDALVRNQRLWGSLMFDCMEPENPLPDALKASIISLAIFIDDYTSEVLTGKKKVGPLITINRNVIQGLKGVAPAPEAAAPAQAAVAGA